jgi:hypothetical protein
VIGNARYRTPCNASARNKAEELYDVDTLTPMPEHQAVYDKVREELIRLGVPLT